MTQLWGGRFSEGMTPLMHQFNDSIYFDVRLWEADLDGSMAYARALARAGVITEEEADILQDGLDQVRAEFAQNRFELKASDEDIHTAVERRLGELVGEVAGKLHTGRSRNDQAATDTRLWLKRQIAQLRAEVVKLQQAIIAKADEYFNVIMPGYTHLQQAQPVRFSHWLLSYGWMLQRDRERLDDLTQRVDVLPLGSGALAGNPLGIDRPFLAEALGFAAISANSMDAVGDRDYLVEFLSWAAITQMHLSRLAEDLIIYSSREFGFVTIADAYSTGSSLMPQKKNADSLELIRGKTGRVVGHLTGLLTMLKGLPSTYDKDMQEDKEPLFDTVDTLLMSLPIAAGVVATLTVDASRIYDSMDSAMLATELADYLVSKGLPFRQAHHLVGEIVRKAIELDQPLFSFPLAAYQQFSPLFERDVHSWLTFNRAADRRTSLGGTGESAVREQWEALRRLVEERV
ncbi:MAG: argininosuccinate lyase [Anaerolineae bacterium]|nr:argininosuccinate lyase [Anaerolineales bacterium]MCQ3975070.1 argininosuccinate lyase [Anaerolineae bacterium]